MTGITFTVERLGLGLETARARDGCDQLGTGRLFRNTVENEPSGDYKSIVVS